MCAPNGLPLEPYTPTITSIVANYISAVAAPAQFYHLHPFGIAPTGMSNIVWPDADACLVGRGAAAR